MAGPDGTPLLSWRVLLLPYLGEQKLFDQFDLTKAWDDPANVAATAKMPDVFTGPESKSGSVATGYAGVAGSTQLFAAAGAMSGGLALSDVFDGASMTIAVGPVGPGVDISWAEPRDITVTPDSRLGKDDGFAAPGGIGTPMLFLDGAVRTLPDNLDAKVISEWSTVAGGGCAPPDGRSPIRTAKCTPARSRWRSDEDAASSCSDPTTATSPARRRRRRRRRNRAARRHPHKRSGGRSDAGPRP